MAHRKHHTFTDREGDPHSPRLLGFWRVQLFNVYYYAREARNPETLQKFAPDWLDRVLFSRGGLGLVTGTALLGAALGFWAGLLAMAAHAHPRAPKFSVRRLEFDPSWLVIRAGVAVRLVVVIGSSVQLH